VQLNLTGLSMPRSSHAVTTLLNAVLAVGSGLDLSEVLTRIVRSACDLVGARYGALGVLRPDGEGLMEFVTSGLTPEEAGQVASQPFGHGVLGTLIRDPRPLRLSAVGEHPDAVGFPPGHPVMKSFLGVPVRVRGRVFGNLYLTDKRGAEGAIQFTKHERDRNQRCRCHDHHKSVARDRRRIDGNGPDQRDQTKHEKDVADVRANDVAERDAGGARDGCIYAGEQLRCRRAEPDEGEANEKFGEAKSSSDTHGTPNDAFTTKRQQQKPPADLCQ